MDGVYILKNEQNWKTTNSSRLIVAFLPIHNKVFYQNQDGHRKECSVNTFQRWITVKKATLENGVKTFVQNGADQQSKFMKKPNETLALIAQQHLAVVKKEENIPVTTYNQNAYGYGSYQNRRKHKLTDFELVTYQDLFSGTKAVEKINNAHQTMGASLKAFIKTLKGVRSDSMEYDQLCQDFMSKAINSPFLDDGTFLDNWAHITQLIDESRIRMAAEKAEEERNKPEKVNPYYGSRYNWDDDDDLPGPGDDEIPFELEDSEVVFLPEETLDPEYNVQMFIDFFEAIPEGDWTVGTYENEGKKDVFGHLGCQRIENREVFTGLADGLVTLFNKGNTRDGWTIVASICDGKISNYPQEQPRERVLAALKDLKAGKFSV